MKLVLVDWVDAISADSGWKTIEKMKKAVPHPCRSVGWIVNQTKDFVTLVSSLTDDGDCDGDILIPRGMIKSIKILAAK